MKRSLAVIVTFWAALMVAFASTAAADTTSYPAPPITATSTVVVTTSASDVVTSSNCACSGALPNTGAGFDIGLTLLIGGVVVLVGVAFTILGAKRLRRH